MAALAGSGCAAMQASPGRSPGIAGIERHQLEITLEAGVLRVTDRLTLTPDGRLLAFRVRAGLWIDSLRAGGRELEYEEVPIGDGGDGGDGGDRIVRVDVPPSATSITVDLSGDPGHGVSEEFVHLPGHSGWYPAPAGGRATRFDATVELPAHLQVMAAGRRVVDDVLGDRRRVRFESVLPARGWSLTAGRYTRYEEDARGVPISVWLLESGDDPALARVYLGATRAHLAEGVRRFGPFPHPGFSVVEAPFPAGQGHPGYTLLGSAILRLPFIPETSARHELFHCWWGNGVMSDPRSGNWTEGLTSYLADHEAAARKAGDGGAGYRWQVLYDAHNFGRQDPPPLLEVIHAQGDRTLGYGKASMVFHMLRTEIGDEAFSAGLRGAVADALGRQIDWLQLLAYFAEAAGRPLDGFVDRWIRAGDHSAPVDPDAHVWSRLAHAQVAPSFDLVASDRRRRVVALSPEFDEVAERLADDDWPLIPAQEADLTDHSLLIVARRGAPLTIGGRTLQVPADRPWPPGATLLFATSPSWAPGHAAGVMLADDLDSLEQAAAKLKWYSRYGWLLFDGATNIDKAVIRR